MTAPIVTLAYNQSADINDMFEELVDDNAVTTTHTLTEMILSLDEGGGNTLTGDYVGTGLTYSAGPSFFPQLTGAITSYTEARNGTDIFEITNLNLKMSKLAGITTADMLVLIFKGNNTMNGSGGADTIEGFAGKDTIVGAGGADSIDGDAGNDSLLGGAADDTLNGGDGKDSLDSGSGFNTLNGGDGNDTLVGFGTSDNLNGDDGNDFISASGTNNIIHGGEGKDTVSGSNNDEHIFGEGGNDSITSGGGDNNVDGGDGNDTITASSGEDTIVGGNGNDSITSADNDDLLHGDAGKDALHGGNGDDTMYGGDGKDLLDGDSGSDLYVFDTAPSSSNADTILDFGQSIGDADEIWLDNGVMFLGFSGALDPTIFVLGTAAGDANDRIIYDEAKGRVYYDADGTGATKKILIAVIGDGAGGHPTLASTDFTVY